MLLSLSGFLFEDDYASQSVPFARFCEIAASTGYGGIELRRTQVNPDTPAHERREQLRIANAAGLCVTCLTTRGMHAEGPERDEFFDRYLGLCADLECGLLKTGGEPEWMHTAAEKAKPYGVVLAVNNHVGTITETVAGTREHLRAVDHPNAGLLYDCLHLMVTGEDYLGCIEEFAPCTHNILVHSLRQQQAGEPVTLEKAGKTWTAALPDEPGVQCWSDVFKRFRAAGYDGPVTVIESGWPAGEAEEVARRCACAVRRLWMEGGS